MGDDSRTREELLEELSRLRRCIGDLESLLCRSASFADSGDNGKEAVLAPEVREDLGEKMKNEQALRESEERFRVLTEMSPAAIFIVRGEEYLYVNPAWEECTGYARDEAPSMPLWHGIRPLTSLEEIPSKPETGDGALECVVRQNGKGLPLRSQVRIVTKGGQRKWLDNSATMIDFEGRPAVLGVALDITPYKRAEEALKRRDGILEAVRFAAEQFLKAGSWEENLPEVLKRLGTAAEVSRVYIFENHVSDEGRLLKSLRFEWTATGVRSELDNPLLQGFPYRDGGLGRWVAGLGRGDAIHGHVKDFPLSEQKLLTAQGIQSIVIAPIFVGTKWWGFIGFDDCRNEREWSTAEIDALKAAATTLGSALLSIRNEKALRKSEREKAIILGSISELLTYQDLDLKIVWANPVASESAGLPLHKMIGRHCYEIRCRLGEPCEDCPVTKALQCNRPQEGEVKTPDGKIWYIRGYPVRDEGGRVVGAVEVTREITEQKRVNEQLKTSLHEKEVLLREIHHRVKNNLQIISSLLKMSSRRTRSSEAEELLTDACNRVHNMALIHMQLYEGNRFERIDMSRHLQRLMQYLAEIYSASERGISPTVEASNIYMTLNQAIPCSLILNELISNAFKHAFEGVQGGRVEVSISHAGDDWVTIRVADDGVGMPQGIRIEAPDTLGLGLVRGLTRQLQGHVCLKREKGTEITLDFRLRSYEGSHDAVDGRR